MPLEIATMEIGSKLANGAKILAIRKHWNNGFVVLAEYQHQYENFVTWRCTNPDDTSWGHYFTNYVEAFKDYLER